MNDNDITALPGMPSPQAKPKGRKGRYIFLALSFLILIAGAGIFYMSYMRQMQSSPSSQDIAQIQQRLTGLENSIHEIDSILYDANGNLTVGKPAANDTPPKATDTHSAADIARLQSDLVAMSSALTSLQDEVKQASSHAQQSQHLTQSTLASAIAYIQLRATATTNQPFATELSAMREASSNDVDFQQALSKLQNVATTGAPTTAELRDELMTLEAPAAQAIDQHAAQSWWQKFVVEIKGLVSVRKIHAGDVDALSTIETDLVKNDLSAALSDYKNLPAEAQTVLRDWRSKVEARQSINEALHDLAEHFNALAQAPAPSAP